MSKLKQVEEIVLAVRDPERAVARLETLFDLEFNRSWSVPKDHMSVRCAMIGQTQFHVVGATEPDTLIDRFVRTRGEGLHHVAFQVSDLDGLMDKLKASGITVVPEVPRTGRSGSRYAFVHPKDMHGMLMELIER
jgi:methylmalonyl-CoA/ethylmalonyl-CoA epimerase